MIIKMLLEQIVDIEKYKDKYKFKIFNEPFLNEKRDYCGIRRI